MTCFHLFLMHPSISVKCYQKQVGSSRFQSGRYTCNPQTTPDTEVKLSSLAPLLHLHYCDWTQCNFVWRCFMKKNLLCLTVSDEKVTCFPQDINTMLRWLKRVCSKYKCLFSHKESHLCLKLCTAMVVFLWFSNFKTKWPKNNLVTMQS